MATTIEIRGADMPVFVPNGFILLTRRPGTAVAAPRMPDPAPSDTSANEPAASIVVVTFNSRGQIARCLEAVQGLAYPHFETIVVDNASSDGTASLVRERFPEVRLLESRRNLGFAGGARLGAEVAAGDVLALLNPDTVVSPPWLRALVDVFRADPAVGVAGCKIYEPDGRTLQHAGGLFRANALTEHRGRGEADRGQYDRLEEVPYVTGAALAIRWELVSRCGFLDTGYYPAYFEEADFCLRVRRTGFKVVYVPGATLLHQEASSTGAGTPEYFYAYHRNRIRFVLKTYAARDLAFRFLPTELVWMRRHLPAGSRISLARAYLDNLLRLPATLAARLRTAHV